MAVLRPPLEEWIDRAKPAASAAPEVLNEETVRRLSEWDRIAAFKVVWTAPPVPFLDGLKLAELRARYDDAVETDNVAALGQVFAEAAPIVRRCVRPLPLIRRALYWLGLWRPWRNMSNADFNRVLAFLLTSRTRSSVRIYSPPGGRHR